MPEGSRKRILMVIPNLGFGGAQRVFHDLAVCLSARHEVIECVFNFDNGHAYPTENKIVSLEVPAGSSVPAKLYYFILRILRLRRLKKELNVDVTVSHLEGADYVNILSRTGEKVILCIHGSKQHDQKITGWLGWVRKNILLKSLYRRADKIVTVANGIKDELLQSFGVPPAKVEVINNGFNLAGLKERSQEPVDVKLGQFMSSKAVLITHGRLAEEKDQITLINIMADIGIREKFRLVIIGDGPLRDKLVNHARQMGLNVYSAWNNDVLDVSHEVIFWGYDVNPFALLGKASLYLFPSLYEGFPLALGEALACGLPVIARDCPYGPGDILNPQRSVIGSDGYLMAEFGILVSNGIHDDPHKTQVWVNAIHALMENRTLLDQYKVKALQQSNTMSQEVFCQKWISVL